MNRTKTLHISGTGSGVGKSVIVSALCRIFLQDGYKVCPFKAQNMALNSFVTKEGGEIGRAQAVQARACRIEPTVDMNPILIKPTSDRKAQVILKGRPAGNMSVVSYINYKRAAQRAVLGSFRRLESSYDVIVIEGAGSPAEINLREHDIVNMAMAEAASSPVILIGDIDKGGVFAWLIGTLELLTEDERRRIKGFIINKFRGDKRLLKGGISFLEKRASIPVLGVIPYIGDLKIQEEDSVPLESLAKNGPRRAGKKIKIDVIYLPHISNFTDFDMLGSEEDVSLRYVRRPIELDSPDIIILPGTKNTFEDLVWLKRTGIAKQLLSTINHKPSTTLIGICGGYQMLGERIYDSYNIESSRIKIDGLHLLPVKTTLLRKKVLAQVKARHIPTGLEISGYEIHHGKTEPTGRPCDPIFEIFERRGRSRLEPDGAQSLDRPVWGTYIHGVFDSDNFRRNFLNQIRARKGWDGLEATKSLDVEWELDRLANIVRKNIDMDLLYEILHRKL